MPPDKPQESYLRIKRPPKFEDLYFRWFTGSAQADNQQMIKNINDKSIYILGINEIIDSPKRVWSRGLSVPDERM